MPRFDRRCAVIVGPEGGTGVRVDERFRISFRVVKTLGTDVNTSDVRIYGLSQDTRQRILSEGEVVQVEAGYASGTEVLGIADITRSVVERQPPDIITLLECGDGVRALRDRKVALSFEAGASVQRVLDRIAQELALGERATGAQVDGVYQEGVSFSGPAKEALNRVTQRAGVTWSIQDGELQILDRVEAAQGRGVLLTPETGLLHSPERLDDVGLETDRQKQTGWRVRTLLNPKIRPGERIVVESAEVSGEYRIDTVEHVGDTRANDWYTEAEVYGD